MVAQRIMIGLGYTETILDLGRVIVVGMLGIVMMFLLGNYQTLRKLLMNGFDEASMTTIHRLDRRVRYLEAKLATAEEALELIWRDAEKYSGWRAMREARAALTPTDTKESGR